jgi:hypothetical protein
MKHNYLFTLLLLSLVSALRAQGPVWNWSTSCGITGNDKALDVAMGSDGSVYSCGFFNGTGTFGSITTGSGGSSKDAFVAKQDAFGNYIWANYCNSGLDDRALGVHVDKDDNVIICGTFWGGMQVGPYYLSGSADSPFIVKYDQAGNLIWAVTGGGDGDDHAFDMVTDQLGNIYVTGFLSTHYGPPVCTAQFGSLPSFSYSDSIAFLAKLSPAGVWQWVRTFDGTDVQRDNDIVIDNNAGVYVVGGFYGANKSFGTATLSSVANSRDIFVVKYDVLGNYQWVKQVGGYNDDRANGVTCGADGFLYVTGEFRAELHFDGDTLNNNGGPGGKDIFVAKLDQQGNWLWASKAGSDSGGESGRAITSNSQHCIYVTGQIKGGNVRFGNNISLSTGTDSVQIFTAGIDTAGVWRWAVQAGGAGEDRGYGVECTNDCKVYTVGYYQGPTSTFGPAVVTSYGFKDGFVYRLDATCFNYVNDTLSSVNESPALCAPYTGQLLLPEHGSQFGAVYLHNISCLNTAEWVIYNILGEPVYRTTQLTAGWNGCDSNGSKLPAGTYVWRLNTMDQPATQYSGRIVLVR